ncbi:MAG TPA: radical SAM protein [Vicinamibacterales bacterium]|nr:radical SAM protein [Vicinamibacterales bacterium]
MLGARTLLVNPPLIGGIAFTRQGRCQEREEVLGTTKPPYTLALAAAMFREKGCDVRLVDLTASRQDVATLIASLDREGFKPTLLVFPSTTPTLDADVVEMLKLKRHFGAPMFSFGPHVSTTPEASMERAPDVDGMFVGEPEDGLLALAMLSSASEDDLETIPSLTFRRGGQIVPARAHGSFTGFLNAPFPAWELLDLSNYRLPLVDQPYVIVETSRGCPYTCDFCVAPIHQGHKFRERSAKALVDEMERGYRQFGLKFFYLWGDTVTLNVKSFSAFCEELIARNLPVQWFGNARADNLVDEAFVKRLRQAGCWMLALGIETESEETRKDMMKRLEGEKIRKALRNMRAAGIKSFGFFILGYPGDTRASLDKTIDYAIDLDPDFANFYPAVPYPGTDLHAKAKRDGLLASEDWSRMEYSFYLLKGNGLDEPVVLDAINRAKRRFYLRPGYLLRHTSDIVKLASTKWSLAWHVGARVIFGSPVTIAARPAPPIAAERDQRSTAG